MPELAKIAWTSDECALGPDPGGAASDALLSQAVSVTRSSLSDAHNRRGNLHANSYQNPAMQLQPVCLLCGASSGENNEAVLPFLPFRLRGDEISLGGSAVDALAPTVEVLQRGLRLCDQASNGILAPWADLQEELLSHVGYREHVSITDEVAMLSVTGTALRHLHTATTECVAEVMGLNAAFGLRVEISNGPLLIGVATATGVLVPALPRPPVVRANPGRFNRAFTPSDAPKSSFFGAAPVAGPDLGHSRPLTASTVSHPMRPTPEVLERLNEAVACHLQRRKGDSSAPAVADSFDWPLDPLL
eukprot:s632_g26.t1